MLEKRLNKAGYKKSGFTPGVWTHTWRPISFTLCVDDFGVKYVGKKHAEHLISVLKQDYTISQDWTGAKYLGINLDWDYAHRQVHCSMLDYIPAALKRFNHVAPKKPQHQPYPHTKPKYGQKVQYAKGADESPPLSKADKKFVQEVVGVFLYYARAVDLTVLTALGSLAPEQASPTENKMTKSSSYWNTPPLTPMSSSPSTPAT